MKQTSVKSSADLVVYGKIFTSEDKSYPMKSYFDHGVNMSSHSDFLLVNKDVLSCPVTEIHEAKPAATYFEGKKVYAM